VGMDNPNNDVDTYINGTCKARSTSTDTSNDASDVLRISGEDAAALIYGKIDEIRLSNIKRNDTWLETSYNTVNNATNGGFFSLGSEEETSTTFNNGTFYGNDTSWVDGYNTKYWWSINATDGSIWTNSTYSFTTENNPPTQSNEGPANQSTDQSVTPALNVTCIDNDAGDRMNATWWSNSSGSWVQFANNNTSFANNTNIIQTNNNFSNYSITYYWSVNLTDGEGGWNNETYHFTTEAISTSIDTITPYEKTASTLELTATGDSGIDNVTLWYRYSSDNSTWWNSSWTYRKKITIDHNQLREDLTNFPILVNITDSNLSSKAQSDGDDIVFTNSTGTKLNHEIENYSSTTGELIAWVNVTSLDSSTDTGIYMYYNNSGSGNQENIESVWDSNYILVHHMHGSSYTNLDDSTSNNHDVNAQDGDPTCQASGKIGYAVDFDGTGDSLEIPDHASLSLWTETSTSTVELWYYQDSSDAANQKPICKDDEWQFVSGDTGQDGDYDPYWGGFGDNTAGDVGEICYINTWHYWAVGMDNPNNDVDTYINGTCKARSTSTDTSNDASDVLRISGEDADALIYGKIDEIRLSNIKRNDTWLETSYNTVNNATDGGFFSLGNEDSWMEWNDANNPDTDHASGGWNWTFDYPNGTGYYEFYSIGDKSGSTTETAPNSADAACYYRGNTAPEITNPYPSNQSTSISVNPTLNISLNDTDGNSMTIKWYSNSSGTWKKFGTNTTETNGTFYMTNANFTNFSKTFYWNVTVNDGTATNTSDIFWFTTIALSTSIDSITPYNKTTSPYQLNATVNDQGGVGGVENITLWYTFSSNNVTWWNSSWKYRNKITIDHNQVKDSLSNFPMLVNITDTNLSNKAQSDGDDIVFTDSSCNKLSHEIENYTSATGNLIAWVNVTSVSSSTDTEIWIYYGNST